MPNVRKEFEKKYYIFYTKRNYFIIGVIVEITNNHRTTQC